MMPAMWSDRGRRRCSVRGYASVCSQRRAAAFTSGLGGWERRQMV